MRAAERRLYTMKQARRFLMTIGRIPWGTTKHEVHAALETYGVPLHFSEPLHAHVVLEADLIDHFPNLRHEPHIALKYGRPGGDPPPCLACGGGHEMPHAEKRRYYAPSEHISPNAVCYVCGRIGVNAAEALGGYAGPPTIVTHLG